MIDLQRTVAARFPRWFEGHRARVSRPLLNAFARFSQVPRINEFLARNAHLRGGSLTRRSGWRLRPQNTRYTYTV